MVLKTILVILSSLLTIGCFLPYFIDMAKGRTKPKIISWIIWSTLTGIACVAALVEHQLPTAILLFVSSAGTLFIAIYGWKNGDKKIERIDLVCLIGAAIGVILWIIFNSPAMAVLATILIDFIGGIPTLVHSWKKPKEETWATFLLSCAGAFFTLLTIEDWQIAAFAYPLFLVLVNLEFTVVIIARRQYLKTKKR